VLRGIGKGWEWERGSISIVIAPGSMDFSLLAYASWWTGATVSRLDFSSTENDIAHVLTLIQPTYVCVAQECLNRIEAAIKTCGLCSDDGPKVFTLLC
jgi:4-coumarate--CoA ligase